MIKTLSLAVLLIVSVPCSYATSLVNDAPEFWGTASNGLQIAISPVYTQLKTGQDPEFDIAVRNVGTNDVFLNLGMTLGNGRSLFPTAIHLVLLDAQGHRRELEPTGPASVSGRIDDYAVGLQAGAVHVLRVRLSQYWCPQTKEWTMKLEKGAYRIAAQLSETHQHHNNSGFVWVGWNTWVGTLQSNFADFIISD
ncbi:MAG TPA: hypothetical protein VMP11_09675 [Verrucomicrobiae bacterium]|nr:hypothetical protein [Verrucomicrobiae bacterium]